MPLLAPKRRPRAPHQHLGGSVRTKASQCETLGKVSQESDMQGAWQTIDVRRARHPSRHAEAARLASVLSVYRGETVITASEWAGAV